MSVVGPKAEVELGDADFQFTPKADMRRSSWIGRYVPAD
jgi:hypothetical protein